MSIADTVTGFLQDIFVDGSIDITPASNLRQDLGLDSLDLVEFLMTCEEEFNLKISDEDAAKIRTVGQVVEFVEEAAK